VGGTYQSNAFTSDTVSLRRQAVIGSLVQGSVNITTGNQGNFQMQIGQTVFVNIDGLSGLQSGALETDATRLTAGVTVYGVRAQFFLMGARGADFGDGRFLPRF
jgi:hypothetical protein